MILPRSVEEWAASLCEHHNIYNSECGYCGEFRDTLLAYAAEQIAAALEDHRFCKDGLWLCHDAERLVREEVEQVAQARVEEREACAKLIPTTWLDPLLTGAGGVLKGYGPWGCPEIERLLRAIAATIRRRGE